MDAIKIPIPIMMDIVELKKHKLNVKEHPETQINNLMNLIKMVGFKDPIVIDRDNIIWAGHGRLEAAFRLAMPQVPIIYLEDLSESQKKLFMYMDNQINESPWVMENVKILLGEIPQIELEQFQVDFNDILGITIEEQDEIPEVPVEPKSKLGDVYQLGNHRVMCGDSTKDLDKLINGVDIDLLLTDPPYGVDYTNKSKMLNKLDGGNRIEKDISGDKEINYLEFYSDFIKLIPFAKVSSMYIFQAHKELKTLLQVFENLQIKLSTILVWNKNNHVLGRNDYQIKHEFIVYGWKHSHKFYGGFQTSVLDFDKPLVNDLHPTMKPTELLCRLIKNSTKKDMMVYDPFLGSGSTLISCEHTNRVCLGMEIDPSYIDVCVERWENFTGKKAELIKTHA